MRAKIASGAGMYYQLYREIDGKHYVGMIDHRIGQIITEISPEEAGKLKFHESDGTKGYTEKMIDTFSSFDAETMDKLVNNGRPGDK
jgi:hypothetical protein